MSDNLFDECGDIPTLIHQLVGFASSCRPLEGFAQTNSLTTRVGGPLT